MDRSVRKVIPVEQGLRQLFNCLIVYDTLYVRKVIPVEQGLRRGILCNTRDFSLKLERLFQ